MNCRGCGVEIRYAVKNTVAGLAEPDHDEAGCLVLKLNEQSTLLADTQSLCRKYKAWFEDLETYLSDHHGIDADDIVQELK